MLKKRFENQFIAADLPSPAKEVAYFLLESAVAVDFFGELVAFEESALVLLTVEIADLILVLAFVEAKK